MALGSLIRRSLRIVWNHKWLLLIGILVLLGGRPGNLSSTALTLINPRRAYLSTLSGLLYGEGVLQPSPAPAQVYPTDAQVLSVVIGATVVSVLCCALPLGSLLIGLSGLGHGALIVAVDAADAGRAIDLGASWRMAWEKKWRLIAIEALLLVQSFLASAGWIVAGAFDGIFAADTDVATIYGGGPLPWPLFLVTLLSTFVGLLIYLLQTLARRACMLEDTGVLKAFARGWAVLRANVGPTLLLYAIQIVLMSLLGGVQLLVVPLMHDPVVLCLTLPFWIVWPLVGLVVTVILSAMWTLAWRRWTGRDVPGEAVMEAMPAV